MRKSRIFIFISIVLLVFTGMLIYRLVHPFPSFSGKRAYHDVIAQVNFGPRTTGSKAHSEASDYIQGQLEQTGWQVTNTTSQWNGFSVQNIISARPGTQPRIIIGAHYDSRSIADQDTGGGKKDPVPGANDGASGVAILLELARTLPPDSPPVELVFFDAEDDGGLDGRDWIMGSRSFVSSLTEKPRAVIILDMVGDAHLNIFMERNSNKTLTIAIWAQAQSLGYQNYFIPDEKYSMLDDHTPFLQAGIPAVDIIDFDYPFWHTSEDTADKVSAHSLQVVGQTVWSWIVNQK